MALFKDEGVVVPLDSENPAVSLAFLFGNGVHLVPGLKKFTVLAGKLDAVGLFHIEMHSGNESPDLFSGLDLLEAEIHDGLAFPVHWGGIVGPLGEHKVAAVSVYLADRGVKVVQVTFQDFEQSIIGAAVLAPTFLPAGHKVSHVVGGDDMLPFYGFCPLETLATGIFPGPKVTGAVVHFFLVVVLAAAIDGLLQVTIVDAFHLLASPAVVVMLWCGFLVYGAKDDGDGDGYNRD